jgi:hypothetical protein
VRQGGMPTSKEYRHRAEECLRLANETKEIFARMALLELVAEFRTMAQQLELRERRNTKQRFSAAAFRIGEPHNIGRQAIHSRRSAVFSTASYATGMLTCDADS